MQEKRGSHFINERFAPLGRPLYLSVHISRIRESTLGRSSSDGLLSWLDNYISVELNSTEVASYSKLLFQLTVNSVMKNAKAYIES